MRMRTFLLSVLLITLSGCIVTYRDFPNATLESLQKNHEPKPLYYHVEPIITQDTAVSPEQREMSKGPMSRFMAGMFIFVAPHLYAVIPQIDPIGEPGYHEVARTLSASGMFSDLHLIDPPAAPDSGVYCYVSFDVRERSGWVSAYGALHFAATIVTLGLYSAAIMVGALPNYAEEGGTTVVYTLYRDGQLQHIYSYPITKKGAGWIGLLPFAWLNFFTNDLKDAVHGTTLQFLLDAHHEGYL